MGILIAFVFGVFLGSIFTYLFYVKKGIGTLRVDQSDPNEEPYLFLELKKPVSTFRHSKIVIMDVKNENFVSHD